MLTLLLFLALVFAAIGLPAAIVGALVTGLVLLIWPRA